MYTIQETSPLGLPQILKELNEKDGFIVLHKTPKKPFEYNKIVPFLFKGGLPYNLTKNLQNEEKEEIMTYEPEKKTLGIWQRFKKYFNQKKSKEEKKLTERKLGGRQVVGCQHRPFGRKASRTSTKIGSLHSK